MFRQLLVSVLCINGLLELRPSSDCFFVQKKEDLLEILNFKSIISCIWCSFLYSWISGIICVSIIDCIHISLLYLFYNHKYGMYILSIDLWALLCVTWANIRPSIVSFSTLHLIKKFIKMQILSATKNYSLISLLKVFLLVV